MPQKWRNVTEELIAQIKEKKDSGLGTVKTSNIFKINPVKIRNIFDLIDKREENEKLETTVNEILNNDWSSAKRMAAEQLVKMLNEGNPAIAKWVMERSKGTVFNGEGDVFGNEETTKGQS